MTRRKLKVAVLFGGKSAEHEVSLQSARNVIKALNKEKYEVIPIGINRAGKWLVGNTSKYLLHGNDPRLIKLHRSSKEVALVVQSSGALADINGREIHGKIDVVFPVLHGPYGEDGSIQGLLKLAGVPCVGAGVLGSSVGMDKDVAKRLLRDAGISVATFVVSTKESPVSWSAATKKLGIPLFVKPANLGSSVGISKVRTKQEFKRATQNAFRFDIKILIEECVRGREIECAVLGNENPQASVPGEVIVNHDFYSYGAKYLDENGATLEIPAKLPRRIAERVRAIAVKTYKTLCCEGMGRVDFFVTNRNKIYVNEINTIPGFTSISMYPKLWEKSGISYTKLIDMLIGLAIERHKKQQRLKTTR